VRWISFQLDGRLEVLDGELRREARLGTAELGQ